MKKRFRLENSLFILLILILSCGPNAEKQKELELKEREIAVREKEVALKEKAQTTTNQLNRNTPIDSSKITLKIHNNFKSFWSDFKKAALSNNKIKVLEMTHIPFHDTYQEIYNSSPDYIKKPTFTCQSKNQFLSKYGSIFVAELLTAIKSDKYRAYQYDDLIGGDTIKKGEYIVIATANSRVYALAFKKWNGIYELSYMPYFE